MDFDIYTEGLLIDYGVMEIFMGVRVLGCKGVKVLGC